MSVSEVKLSSTGVSGGFNSGDTKTTPLAGSYRSRHLVKCDDADDTADIVLLHFKRTTSLPWIGRSMRLGNGFDKLSLCRGVEANYVEKSGGWFTVDSRFEPLTIQEDEQEDIKGQKTHDPFDWHDEIEVFYTQYSKPVEKAEFKGFSQGGGSFVGNKHMKVGSTTAMTNSARVPYDPPLEEEFDIEVIRITKIAKDYDGNAFGNLNGRINSDKITISKPEYGFKKTVDPYKGKMKLVGGAFNLQNGFKFWRHTAELHIHPDTWMRDVLDQGFEELFSSGETTESGEAINATTAPLGYKYVPIEVGGVKPTSPLMLNGKGKKLKPTEQAVYARWLTKKVASFAGIKW